MTRQMNQWSVAGAMRALVTVALALAAMPIPVPSPNGAHAGPAARSALASSSTITTPPGAWITNKHNYRRTSRVDNASANITAPALKWTYRTGSAAGARLADITGPGGLPDGVPELVAFGGGRVSAFNVQATPPLLLWQSDIIPGLGDLMYIGDLDGDGSAELLFNFSGGLIVLRGRDGAELSRIARYGPIAVADANNDGKMELFAEPGPGIYTFAGGAGNPQLVASFSSSGGGLTSTLARSSPTWTATATWIT